MNKLIKTSLYLVAAVIFLVVAAIVILPMMIDPNDYKAEITEKVKQASGRELVLAGDLDLSVFPWLGVETGPATLSNAPGFGDSPFASVNEAAVRVKLLPLLSKKVEVSRVVFKDLVLNLAKNSEGVTNWSDLAKPSDQPREQEKAAKPAKPEKGKSPKDLLAALAIGGISIENAKVIWDDRQSDKHVEIDEFNFLTDEITFGSPIDLDLNFKVHTDAPAMTESLDLRAAVTIPKTLDALNVAKLALTSRTGGEIVAGGEINAKLAVPEIDVTSNMEQIQIGQINLDINATGEKIPGGKFDARLVGSLFADLASQTLKISGLNLTAKDLDLKAELSGKKIIDGPVIEGPVTLNEFSPRNLLSALGMKIPEIEDKSVLNKLSAKFDLLATKNSAALSDVLVNLDETIARGKTSVHNFSQPAIAFTYSIDQIDIDRYLPPKKDQTADQQSSKQPEPTATPASATAAAASKRSLENLRKLDIDGRVDIGSVKVSGLQAKGIEFTVKGKNGLIQTRQYIKNLYRGNYNGGGTLDARGSVLIVSLNETLSNVNLTPLLEDATGKETLAGIAHATIKMSGRGLDPEAIKKSLDGTITADINDGAVYGINVIKLIRETKARIEGKPIPPSTEPEKTEFSELRLHATAKNGIVNNDTLEAKSPYLRMNGAGKVGLIDQSLDYRMQVKIVKTPAGQGGEGLKDLKGIPIHLMITGTTKKPKYGVDIQAALTEVYKGKVKEKVDKEKEKVLEKIEKNIGKDAADVLKKFF